MVEAFVCFSTLDLPADHVQAAVDTRDARGHRRVRRDREVQLRRRPLRGPQLARHTPAVADYRKSGLLGERRSPIGRRWAHLVPASHCRGHTWRAERAGWRDAEHAIRLRGRQLIMYGGRSRGGFGVYLSQKHERHHALGGDPLADDEEPVDVADVSKRLVRAAATRDALTRRYQTRLSLGEFDGRLSVVAAKMARFAPVCAANTKSKGGGRSVQARVERRRAGWGAFELIRFEGAVERLCDDAQSRSRPREAERVLGSPADVR